MSESYPEISYHRITGSRNQIAETVITHAAMELKQAILLNIPDTAQRAHVMELLVDCYNGAISALGMIIGHC